MGAVSGRSTLINSPSRKPPQFFDQLPHLEGAKNEGKLRNDEESDIEIYSISDVPNIIYPSPRHNITTPIKQEDGTFEATLSSDNVALNFTATGLCSGPD